MKNLSLESLLTLNASANYLSIPGEYKVVDGKYKYVFDFDKVSEIDKKVVLQNIDLIKLRFEARKKIDTILTGDYLIMPDNSISRVTHVWPNSVQDGGGSSSFYLGTEGVSSYSGGLNGSKPLNKITDTGDTKKALFWFFSQNYSGAHRGFYFYIDVKVWKCKDISKTVYVQFEDREHNYNTSVNGKQTDKQIREYFVNTMFDRGTFPEENMQKCIDCSIYY